MGKRSVIEVWAQGRDFIVTIGHESGCGGSLGGYRIAGPKFIPGASRNVLRCVVDEHAAKEIRHYLPRRQRAKKEVRDGR